MTNSEKAYIVNQAFRATAKRYIDKVETDRAVLTLKIMEAMQFDGDFARAMFFDALIEERQKYS